MRFNFNTSATVKRLAAYSNNKSAFAAVSGTIRGYFTPIEPSQKTQALGIIDQAYEFYTDASKDIQVNDILVIGGKNYGVKGAVVYASVGQGFLKCTIQQSING